MSDACHRCVRHFLAKSSSFGEIAPAVPTRPWQRDTCSDAYEIMTSNATAPPQPSIGDFVSISIESIASLVLQYLIGSVAGYYHLVTEADVRSISPMLSKIILPCLAIAALGAGLSFNLCFRQGGWILFIIGGLSPYALYLPVGCLMRRIAQPEPEFSRLFLVMLCIPNIVAIPISLSEYLCFGGTFDDEFTKTGSDATMVPTAVARATCRQTARAYVLLYAALDMVNTFCIAIVYLAGSTSAARSETVRASAASPVEVKAVIDSSIHESDSEAARAAAAPPPEPTPPADAQHPTTRRLAAAGLMLLGHPGAKMVGSVAIGLVIGCIEPLQAAIFADGGALDFVGFAIQQLSQAAVPLLNLMVAFSLGHKLRSLTSWREIFGSAAIGLSQRTLLVLTLGRMLVIPTVVGLVLYAALPLLPPSRLLRVMLFLEMSPPTASVVVLLIILAKRPQLAPLAALALVPQYIIAPLSLSFFMAAAMSLTSS